MPTEIDKGKLLPVNVIRTGFKEHQYHIIRDDGYAAYQISVCVGGEGKFIYENHEHIIRQGDIFMFSPRIPHEYYPVSKKWQMYFFVFLGDSVENLFKYFEFNYADAFGIKSEQDYDKIIGLCNSLVKSDDDYKKSLYIYEMLGLMAQLAKQRPSDDVSSKDEKFRKIVPVLEYIRKNYKEPIILDELAEMIDVSKSYLCRMFKSTYNMTPIKYLQNYRIDRAKQLLIATDIRMKLLCKEVGFNDTSYFCMTFKKSEGMTPEEFRNLHKD